MDRFRTRGFIQPQQHFLIRGLRFATADSPPRMESAVFNGRLVESGTEKRSRADVGAPDPGVLGGWWVHRAQPLCPSRLGVLRLQPREGRGPPGRGEASQGGPSEPEASGNQPSMGSFLVRPATQQRSSR